jgi:hypothetical protein
MADVSTVESDSEGGGGEVVDDEEHDGIDVPTSTATEYSPSPAAAEADMIQEAAEESQEENHSDGVMMGINGGSIGGGGLVDHNDDTCIDAAAATAFLDEAFGDACTADDSFGDSAYSAAVESSPNVIEPNMELDPDLVIGGGNTSSHDGKYSDIVDDFGHPAKQSDAATLSPSTESTATDEILLVEHFATEDALVAPEHDQQQQQQQEDDKESNDLEDFSGTAAVISEIPMSISNDQNSSINTGDQLATETEPAIHDEDDDDDDANHKAGNGKRISSTPSTVVQEQNGGRSNNDNDLDDSFGDFGSAEVVDDDAATELNDNVLPPVAVETSSLLVDQEIDHGIYRNDDGDDDDDFGGFGSASTELSSSLPVPAAASPTADIDETQDFGDFGSAGDEVAVPTTAIHCSDNDDDDFIAPDADADNAVQATTATNDNDDAVDDDDFGSFGNAESATPQLLETDTATDTVPAAEASDDDDFGDFAEVAAPAAEDDAVPNESTAMADVVARAVAPSDDDDDNADFGDFGSAAAELTSRVPTPPANATTDDVVDDEDEDDDFGDFGSADFTSAAASSEPQPAASTAAGKGDADADDFGDFSDFNEAENNTGTPSPSQAAAPAIATPVERIVPGSQRAKSFFLGVFDQYNVHFDDENTDDEAGASLNEQDETDGDTREAVKAMVVRCGHARTPCGRAFENSTQDLGFPHMCMLPRRLVVYPLFIGLARPSRSCDCRFRGCSPRSTQ